MWEFPFGDVEGCSSPSAARLPSPKRATMPVGIQDVQNYTPVPEPDRISRATSMWAYNVRRTIHFDAARSTLARIFLLSSASVCCAGRLQGPPLRHRADRELIDGAAGRPPTAAAPTRSPPTASGTGGRADGGGAGGARRQRRRHAGHGRRPADLQRQLARAPDRRRSTAASASAVPVAPNAGARPAWPARAGTRACSAPSTPTRSPTNGCECSDVIDQRRRRGLRRHRQRLQRHRRRGLRLRDRPQQLRRLQPPLLLPVRGRRAATRASARRAPACPTSTTATRTSPAARRPARRPTAASRSATASTTTATASSTTTSRPATITCKSQGRLRRRHARRAWARPATSATTRRPTRTSRTPPRAATAWTTTATA